MRSGSDEHESASNIALLLMLLTSVSMGDSTPFTFSIENSNSSPAEVRILHRQRKRETAEICGKIEMGKRV